MSGSKFGNDKWNSERQTVASPIEPVVMLLCPFCGGEAKLYGGAYSQETYDAACVKCSASTSGTMDRQESIDRWNKRAT